MRQNTRGRRQIRCKREKTRQALLEARVSIWAMMRRPVDFGLDGWWRWSKAPENGS